MVLAVPHAEYLAKGLDVVPPIIVPGGVVVDVKGRAGPDPGGGDGLTLWRL